MYEITVFTGMRAGSSKFNHTPSFWGHVWRMISLQKCKNLKESAHKCNTIQKGIYIPLFHLDLGTHKMEQEVDN